MSAGGRSPLRVTFLRPYLSYFDVPFFKGRALLSLSSSAERRCSLAVMAIFAAERSEALRPRLNGRFGLLCDEPGFIHEALAASQEKSNVQRHIRVKEAGTYNRICAPDRSLHVTDDDRRQGDVVPR